MTDTIHDPAIVVDEPTQPAMVRSPDTIAHLGFGLAAVGATYLALQAASPDVFATAFGELLSSLPRWLVTTVVAILQLFTLLTAVLGVIGLLGGRHVRRFGRLVLAALIGAGLLVAFAALVGDVMHVLPPQPTVGPGSGGIPPVSPSNYGIGTLFPTNLDLVVIISGLLIEMPRWTFRWRRFGRVVIVSGLAARLGASFEDPIVLLADLALAVSAAQIAQLILGVPNRRHDARSVAATLTEFGFEVESVLRRVASTGTAGYMVRCTDNRSLYVKTINHEGWTALLPNRIYRSIRLRDVGENNPFTPLRHRVEYEALCTLKAASDGAPTPRLALMTELPPATMLMAFAIEDFMPVESLSESPRKAELLGSAWNAVAALRSGRTVHRSLNTDHLIVDDNGALMLVDFSTAQIGVDRTELAADVAELLASTATHVGVEAAVAAAVDGLGPTAVAEALPRLQPLALTRATRDAVKKTACLASLRDEVQRVTGVEAAPMQDLERVKVRTIATLVTAVFAITALASQFLSNQGVWDALRSANLWWAAAALGLSAVTYLGAAVALDGSTTERLPLGPNVGVQLASSYVGIAAPGGALAVTARFLQKRGVDAPVAIAAIGVDTAAGVIVHLALTGVFLGFAGSSGMSTFQLPSAGTIALVVVAFLVVFGLGALIPKLRSIFAARVVPALRRSVAGVAETAHQPSKMISLFGGSLAITLGYVLALAASVSAFGAGPAFTSVALVYLLGSIVASVAPTPGGIGAVEATLVAGLTSAGMASGTALGAVMLFRVTTFWLPLIPGWGAFTALQRSGNL